MIKSFKGIRGYGLRNIEIIAIAKRKIINRKDSKND